MPFVMQAVLSVLIGAAAAALGHGVVRRALTGPGGAPAASVDAALPADAFGSAGAAAGPAADAGRTRLLGPGPSPSAGAASPAVAGGLTMGR